LSRSGHRGELDAVSGSPRRRFARLGSPEDSAPGTASVATTIGRPAGRRASVFAMNPPEEELSLVRACTEGDPRAWEAFVERYTPFLGSCIRRTLARQKGRFDPAEAEAVFQDVFWEIFRDGGKALKAFTWKSRLTTYLWVIAYRQTIEHVYRRRGAQVFQPLPADDSAAPIVEAPGPCDSAVSDEQARLVRDALLDLPARDRRILKLYYFDGKSQGEIAELVFATPASVGMAVVRGRLKIERILRKRGKLPL